MNTAMSIKQAIEPIVAKMRADLEAVGGFENELLSIPAGGVRSYIEKLEAALAAPRSMPTTLGKGITRDDTVHGEEYFTRSQVEAVLRSMPAEPVARDGFVLVPEFALRWLFGEEGEFVCPPENYFRGKEPPFWWRSVFRAMLATPHTEAVRMSEAEIEALFQQAADADEEVHIRFARAVEQATAARLGVKWGDV